MYRSEMTASGPEDDLEAAVRTLLEHGDDRAQRVAGRISEWFSSLAGDRAPLERYLGFPAAWRYDRDRRARAAALTEYWRRHFGALAGRQAAREVLRSIRRYETGRWRQDAEDQRRPDGESGEIYDLLRIGGAVGGHTTLRQLFKDWPNPMPFHLAAEPQMMPAIGELDGDITAPAPARPGVHPDSEAL